ncbi:Protein BOI2 [Ceratocystis lukuohia]|uniref:Protein BOB1 n=2 Tax=Ceratocystis TaxID=5157 RepID=A0A0F8BLK5_CERFI|nr:Protein BOB1 [Ceratocystis platani]
MMSTPRVGPRPEIGDILWVVHDFQARTSDELTLIKGDLIELIERDDEFGDRWYLGRHLGNGNTGLFPEAYTQPAPKDQLRGNAIKPMTPLLEISSATDNKPISSLDASATAATAPSTTISPTAGQQAPSSTVSIPEISTPANTTTSISAPTTLPQKDSQVLHDTLNVIDEHITNLRSPPSINALNVGNDSGSEYSTQYDHRMSYIHGEETDEEEGDVAHTRADIMAWGPDDVAEYLFTAGVEKHHCEIFRDQEITGEVLLEMDQSSLFIKAFDLGSVGRRLKTWSKIKALQDEVASGQVPSGRRTTASNYGSEAGSEYPRTRSRTNTVTSTGRPDDRPSSIQPKHIVTTSTMNSNSRVGSFPLRSAPASAVLPESPTHHYKRPSAASIRDMNHTRNSFSEYRSPSALSKMAPPSSSSSTDHRKQPSFDRNWTMGGAYSTPRPLSSTGLQDIVAQGQKSHASVHGAVPDSGIEMDRGYFSGTDSDAKRSLKNMLKKRDSTHGVSYTEEQRVRSATTMSRHSHYGSVDLQDPNQTASQKYYGVQNGSHRKTNSTATTESIKPPPPAKDHPPTVTKLDSSTAATAPISPASNSHKSPHEWLSAMKPGHRHSGSNSGNGLRAISDSVSSPFSKFASSTAANESSPLASPITRTGSSTASAGRSFELDSPDATKSAAASTVSGNSRTNVKRKNKQDTSAYQRGLLKISPREAMKDADYSGWMKKKSSNLMTTWKPRLFILKGRRLSYYYSEDDDQEKGLIDISFHRVLPADNERLTGLHATLTGAGNPSGSSNETGANGEKGDDGMFIFKLTPPRAGLSRAVNFTKPTVHYFAVPNLGQGRLWMAALMKATIERDDTQPVTTSYQQKTISLAKARQQRHRPPELRDESAAALASEATIAENGPIMDVPNSGVGMDNLVPQSA